MTAEYESNTSIVCNVGSGDVSVDTGTLYIDTLICCRVLSLEHST